MIVTCPCGQKNRLKDLSRINKMICGKCKKQLAPEANRQAKRNADIVLAASAILADKVNSGTQTPEEHLLAQLFAHHELESKK